MRNLITFLALICVKSCQGVPAALDLEPDISSIKYYIAKGQDIIEKTNGTVESNYSLNDEEQKAVEFYNFYYNLADHPRSLYSFKDDGDSIVCFPNDKCVDLVSPNEEKDVLNNIRAIQKGVNQVEFHTQD